MKKVSDKDLKSMELKILLEIDRFCLEHHLRYFLASGTLLGAVRHNGFIPWDDDIDVMMPRPDYDRFMKEYVSDCFILNYPGKPGYYQSIGKLANKDTVLIQRTPLADEPIGVHVDILPLDGEPDDVDEYKRHMKTVERLHRHTLIIRQLKFRSLTLRSALSCIWHWRTYIPYITLDLNETYAKIEETVHKYAYDESLWVGYITMCRYGLKQRHKREIFENTVEVEFEGHVFPAPQGYDEYLRNLFGDYLKLPPLEKRISHHVWTAYWKLEE